MSKRQTRRSVSFRAEVFERIRRHCEKEGVSITGWVEGTLTSFLNHQGAPQVSRDEALRARGILPDAEVEQMRKAAFG